MSAGAWTQRRDVILGELIDQIDRARQHRERLLSQFSEGLLQLEDIERSLREASLGAGADPDVVDGLQRLDSTRHSLAALSRQVAADLRSDHVQHDAARSQAAQAIDRLLADSLPTNAGAMADTIRSLSTRIEQDLEQVLVGLQFQDRMSQMLHGVAADMQRFIEWMASNEHATHADAMRWLTQLEHSYTMREQQLLHDGNSGEGSPPAPTGIEFF
jgi:methyl-accepting chemotaxis protein